MIHIGKPDELWDCYSKDREKLGKTQRRGEKMKPGEYHLVVHVCIFNQKNEILLQQRQAFKRGWPNMWDLSAAGSAIAGETSSQAAERECFEELGVKLDFSEARPYFSMSFSNGYDDYFLVRQDIDISQIKLQQEEVARVKWASYGEVLQMQEQGILIPYWFLSGLFDVIDFYDERHSRRMVLSVDYAKQENIASLLNMLEVVREELPGLENDEAMYRFETELTDAIANRRAICATNRKMVIGFLIYDNNTGNIKWMAVHPEFRKQGLATKMMQLTPALDL